MEAELSLHMPEAKYEPYITYQMASRGHRFTARGDLFLFMAYFLHTISQEFEVTKSLTELELFLLCLKTFVSNANFPTMYFVLNKMSANVIRSFSRFFEGHTVPFISMSESNADSL